MVDTVNGYVRWARSMGLCSVEMGNHGHCNAPATVLDLATGEMRCPRHTKPFWGNEPAPLERARHDWTQKADAVADYRAMHSLIIDTYEIMRSVARRALRDYERLKEAE